MQPKLSKEEASEYRDYNTNPASYSKILNSPDPSDKNFDPKNPAHVINAARKATFWSAVNKMKPNPAPATEAPAATALPNDVKSVLGF